MVRTRAERGTVGRRISRGDSTLPEKNGWDELDLQIDDPWELLLQILKNSVSHNGGT